MKNKIIAALSFLLLVNFANAQDKFFTKSGKVDFYSKAPLEDITAKNKSAVAVLDTKTGQLQFNVLIKGFEFENAEMQEHFNDNYLHSNQYPKAEFKGQVLNNADINYSKPGTYTAKVKGALTIHGVTKEVQTTGTIKVESNNLKTTSEFNIKPADYNIKIAPIVKDKIAKNIKISVDAKLEALK